MNIANTLTCSMFEMRNLFSVGVSFNLASYTPLAYRNSWFVVDEEKTKKYRSSVAAEVLGRVFGWEITTVVNDHNDIIFNHERQKVIYANVLEYSDTNPQEETLLEKYYGFKGLTRWPSNDRQSADIRCLILENWKPELTLSQRRLRMIADKMRKDAISHSDLLAMLP